MILEQAYLVKFFFTSVTKKSSKLPIYYSYIT